MGSEVRETALALKWASYLTSASLLGKPHGGPELLLSIAVLYNTSCLRIEHKTENQLNVVISTF